MKNIPATDYRLPTTHVQIIPPPSTINRNFTITAELITIIRAQNKHPHLHAFPSFHNAPSNTICRKLGCTRLGEVEFEYPLGNYMRCYDGDWI